MIELGKGTIAMSPITLTRRLKVYLEVMSDAMMQMKTSNCFSAIEIYRNACRRCQNILGRNAKLTRLPASSQKNERIVTNISLVNMLVLYCLV